MTTRKITLIKSVLEASAKVDNQRTGVHVMVHLVSELGELAQEVIIAQGRSYKEPGKDGVVGETIDVLLCLIDLLYVANNKDADLVRAITANDTPHYAGDMSLDEEFLFLGEAIASCSTEPLDSFGQSLLKNQHSRLGHSYFEGPILGENDAIDSALALIDKHAPVSDTEFFAIVQNKLDKWIATTA